MLTIRTDVIKWVLEVSGSPGAFDELEANACSFDRQRLEEALLECGVIPEAFPHDSSAEKLWAKYCDILLAMALTQLGVPAEVIRTRGNSADVLAKASGYTIVGDAKAFRLSRTARNQKDFKVTSLDDWRRDNTYACLAGPLTQFPNTNSQIYAQAIERNVTLISYTHIRFLLEHQVTADLSALWTLGTRLPSSNSAVQYWNAVDEAVLAIAHRSVGALASLKALERRKLEELGAEGIAFWEGRIRDYQSLTKEQAVTKLVQAEKIHEKIRTIRKAVS